MSEEKKKAGRKKLIINEKRKIRSISMSDTIKEEAERLSYNVFGRSNISGLIEILVRKAAKEDFESELLN